MFYFCIILVGNIITSYSGTSFLWPQVSTFAINNPRKIKNALKFILFYSNVFVFTHINIINKGRVKMAFNKNTAPARCSKVKLYVALYNETSINDITELVIACKEFSLPIRNTTCNIKIYVTKKYIQIRNKRVPTKFVDVNQFRWYRRGYGECGSMKKVNHWNYNNNMYFNTTKERMRNRITVDLILLFTDI